MVRVAAVALPDNPDGEPPADASRVAEYLASGTAILFTTATTADRYDASMGAPVGLSVRSDGVWVWSDVLAYYADRYGIPPEPELVEHIRRNDYRCPPLDDAAARHAWDAFSASRDG
ncbi:hypothetical protein [Rugosimonospora africana]|uniref:Uncharacterized protein n=1 Tax=Rugosimonospora africana TaxID=556532 RepID=A0A8J3VTW8_9ACTN|nr:hypothetical protein [Rugosimonospora africana]GIH18852.1 hypothetical protein Raf01_70240 [Rugosimonospora africana]